MGKNKNRGGSSAAKSKHTGIKLIAAFALIAALVYVITSLALCVRAGAPVWNPLDWHKAGTTQSKPGGDAGDVPELTPGGYAAIDESGNLMREGVIYDMPETLVFLGDNQIQTETGARAAKAAETLTNGNSVTITATVTPENATDKRVTWECDNPYVTVTPLTEGSNVATVTLTNYSASVFATEAATITCTSVSNPSKSGTCTVSRLATADELNLTYSLNNPLAYNGPNTIYSTGLELKEGGISNLYFGEVDNVWVDCNLVYNETVFNRITQILKAENININFGSYYGDYTFFTKDFAIKTPYEMWDGGGNITKEKFNSAFLSAYHEINGNCLIAVEVSVSAEYSFNGVNFGKVYSDTETYQIDYSSLWVEVGGVEIGGDIVVTQ